MAAVSFSLCRVFSFLREDWWTCSQGRTTAHPHWTCYPCLVIHKITPSPFSLAGMASYYLVRCECQPEVKGQPDTNDQGWWSCMKWMMCSSSNGTFSLICCCCVWLIIHAPCPFHNPKSKVALPHVGLLMLLFDDCQDLWHLFVIYGPVRRAHTGKHALYLQSDLIFLCLRKRLS